MPPFQTNIVDQEYDVERRLADFGLTPGQIIAIAVAARKRADDASPLMPQNAPGTLAYIFGVEELRRQLLDSEWAVDRTCGVEAVVSHQRNLRIAYQNVDRACDKIFAPAPLSPKGNASESMSGPSLFEHAGVDAGPLTGVLQDGVPTYYVMVGIDGAVEVSHPVIKNGSFKHFNERIFVLSSGGEWEEEIDPETGPIDNFDIAVSFKDDA